MKSPDPASLQNLNDIVLPAQVGWWPLAIGWYFLGTLVLVVFAWFVYRSLRYRAENRYRRAALREFQLLETGINSNINQGENLKQIPVLIKRTALSVYPREQVASLTGKDWHKFLNSKVQRPVFTESAARVLDLVSYSAGELNDVDPQKASNLLEATHYWLKHHQPLTGPRNSEEP